MTNHMKDMSLKKMLMANMLFSWGTLVSQMFLNMFLFKNTNDMWLVALFNMILLSTQLLSFTYFASIVKFGYSNMTHVVWLLWLSLVYSGLIILWASMVDYYVLLAIWMWFFSWMYWMWYNNNEFDLTSIENSWNFQWLKKSLKILMSMMIPSLIWIMMWVNYLWYGYQFSFFMWMLFYLASAYVWMMKVEYKKNIKYCMMNAIKKVMKNKNLMKVVSNFSFLGFALSNPLIETVLPLLLFSYWIKEMNLWFLVSTFAFLTVIASYLFWKFVHYKNYKLAYIFSWMFYIILVFMLLFFPNYWYMMLFASMLNLLFSFMDIPQSVFSANIFHEIKWYEEMKSEYMVISEWPLMAWSMLSFVCMYFIWSFEALWIQMLFWMMALIMFISTYLFSSLTLKHD